MRSKPYKTDDTARKSVIENIVGIKLKKIFHYQVLGLEAEKLLGWSVNVWCKRKIKSLAT